MLDKNRLLGHIARNGLTQRSLSDMLNVSKNTLNSKINGKSSFDTVLIDEICEILNITDDTEKARIFLSSPSRNRDNQR